MGFSKKGFINEEIEVFTLGAAASVLGCDI